MSTPFDQSAYQVRFEWGAEGLARLAPIDVIVVVDVLRFSSALVDAVVESPVSLEEARRWSVSGAAVADAASDTLLLVGGLRNATAVAEAILGVQEERQRRTSVAIIALGESAPEGGLRFAVEDQLGAGAIISALSDRGIDHSSPEAAVAAESFRGLRQAVRHLLSGSGSGREIARGAAAGRLRGRACSRHPSPSARRLRSTTAPWSRHSATGPSSLTAERSSFVWQSPEASDARATET